MPSCSKSKGRWLKERVSYAGAHYRVKVVKGRAAQYKCAHCPWMASEWSYMGGDPNELTEIRSPQGIPRKIAYSCSPEYYQPLCKRCHGKADYGKNNHGGVYAMDQRER